MSRFGILILATFLTIFNIHSQEISIGTRFNLHSQVLSEDRDIWVYLPPGYNNPELHPASYPVMYLIDGEMFFHQAVAVQKALAKDMYSYMPEMIIVGICNTNRTRDLTPSRGSLMRNGKTFYQESGGADLFLRFIREELMAWVDSSFRTNSSRLLVGHSFGGLFALHVMLRQPQLFNACFVFDPSLWWNQQTTFTELEQRWSQLDLTGVNLYVAQANDETASSDPLQHHALIGRFCGEMLQPDNLKGVRCNWKYYRNEDHGTIFLPALYDGLRFIYDGICLPVKQIPDEPGFIDWQYTAVSLQTGMSLIPSEQLVNSIGNYCQMVGAFDNARIIFSLNANWYPKSIQAGDALLNSSSQSIQHQ